MATGTDRIVLFTSRTTDGNSTAANIPYSNPRYIVKAFGTFGGATVALQVASPSGIASQVWMPVLNKWGQAVSFTTSGMAVVEGFVQNDQVRAVVSSSSGTTTVSIVLQPSV